MPCSYGIGIPYQGDKPPYVDVLPEVQYFYSMGNMLLSYTDTERDLGVLMNGTLNFTQHADMLYPKASQRLGLLNRTCYFVNNQEMRRVLLLYLTMVRSIFEHCSIVWRPSTK